MSLLTNNWQMGQASEEDHWRIDKNALRPDKTPYLYFFV